MLNLATIASLLASIASFQAKDHGVNRPPQILIEALTQQACRDNTAIGRKYFHGAILEFEQKHHMRFDDEVSEVTDHCNE